MNGDDTFALSPPDYLPRPGNPARLAALTLAGSAFRLIPFDPLQEGRFTAPPSFHRAGNTYFPIQVLLYDFDLFLYTYPLLLWHRNTPPMMTVLFFHCLS